MVGDYSTSSQDLPDWLIGTTACLLCAVAWAKFDKLQMRNLKVQHTMLISVVFSIQRCFKSLHITHVTHVHPFPSLDPVKPGCERCKDVFGDRYSADHAGCFGRTNDRIVDLTS